jgi:Protein of unknown function (DUF3047)
MVHRLYSPKMGKTGMGRELFNSRVYRQAASTPAPSWVLAWAHTGGGLVLMLMALGLLVACAAPTPSLEHDAANVQEDQDARADLSPAARQRAQMLLKTPVEAPWAVYRWPGKQIAAFVPDTVRDRDALRVDSRSSVSVLRQRFERALQQPLRLRFAWKAQTLPQGANLHHANQADSAVRVVLAFDGDRSRLSERQHRLSELALALTGEAMPYATLVYVWSENDPVGTVISSARTDRIRKLVVSSGRTQLNTWLDHDRDVQADYRKAFGEEAGPLLHVALMSDTDNTRTAARVWFGALDLSPHNSNDMPKAE